MSDNWKDRYIELENTLESVIKAAGHSMSKFESKGLSENEFCIRKVLLRDGFEGIVVCCVADGCNLEYKFLASRGSKNLIDTGFQRQNSWPAAEAIQKGATEVTVSVRSHSKNNKDKILSRKLSIKS